MMVRVRFCILLLTTTQWEWCLRNSCDVSTRRTTWQRLVNISHQETTWSCLPTSPCFLLPTKLRLRHTACMTEHVALAEYSPLRKSASSRLARNREKMWLSTFTDKNYCQTLMPLARQTLWFRDISSRSNTTTLVRNESISLSTPLFLVTVMLEKHTTSASPILLSVLRGKRTWRNVDWRKQKRQSLRTLALISL